MSTFSPLLAAKADVSRLRFPLHASPKIDGIRALVKDGVVYARSGKPIPNPHVQQLFGHLHGYDGELVVGDATAPDAFRASQSVMARQGRPDVRFWIFDSWNRGQIEYFRWLAPQIIAQKLGELDERVVLTEQTMIYSHAELDEYEALCLACGFEGVMLRDPDAGYKPGRSTVGEGILLKLKRFADAEGMIVGMEEQRDLSGRPTGLLGALQVRTPQAGHFSLGAGFTRDERERFWRQGQGLYGALVRYRHFPSGAKDKPRFPVFAGLRSPLDLEVAHA